MNPSIEEKVRRPVKYLTAVSQRYPGIWRSVDQLRANRDKVAQHHDWPTWCYLPLPGAAGIITSPTLDDGQENIEAACVATLAGWRLAKDIYIFDETVLEELWNTPIEGNIPIDVLYRLPTLCAYVAFPSPRDVEDGKLHGFFVHLNYIRMPMLVIAMDFGTLNRISSEYVPLAVFPVELHEGVDLLQCLTIMHEKLQRRRGKPPEEIERVVLPEAIKRTLEPLVSLTIYLCSTSAEIRARDPLRGLKQGHYTKKTKKGVRTFVPEQPQVWEVAYRIGATLRAATAAAVSRSTDNGGTHASPRPHMRKAHWHSFWTGPKAAVGKAPVPAREIVLKWIPPIAVAMGPDDETIPTVHRVTR
jgi:hypothetical protein